MFQIPQTQRAVQLTGPDELTLNESKKIVKPGRHQILCKVEAIGLCFSDLKLLKQFSTHARKTPIKSGIDQKILPEISSYVPEKLPTVPGHEASVRVCQVGEGVKNFKPGQRFLVQTDYRWLPTENSNASFGYNFEGALQEYVLMDERIITSPQGESMLIPASERLSASAIALVEPWACVEDSYAAKERTKIKSGGRMLVVADAQVQDGVLENLFARFGRPGQITWIGAHSSQAGDCDIVTAGSVSELKDASYDDVIYFGTTAATLESIFWKVGPRGLINIVQCGQKFGKSIVTAVGRVHYGGIRIIGTEGFDPAEAMATIPDSGEIRRGNKINVIGAGGPMGVMHVIRNICQGVPEITVFAGDLDSNRLAALSKIALPLARKNNVQYSPYNSSKDKVSSKFDYIVLMAPVPALVAQAVKDAQSNAIINIFAGIPAQVTGAIDIDAYVEKHAYFIGTSGSVLEDMKLVLAKVEKASLDTNLSVAAVCGLDGAVEGIRAIEKAMIPGKIIVYPQCKGLGLVRLDSLEQKLPQVAGRLVNGNWTKQAEDELIKNLAGEA